MSCPDSGNDARALRFLQTDLCAQLAPLNLFGLGSLSAALVDGLLTLAGRLSHRDVSRPAA